MNVKTYYWVIAIIGLAELVNYIAGNLIGHFLYEFPVYYFGLILVFIVFGAIVLFAWYQNIMAALILFFYSLDSYYNNFSWGVTGFTLKNMHLQPLVTSWLAMLAMAFCVIGGGWLLLQNKKG